MYFFLFSLPTSPFVYSGSFAREPSSFQINLNGLARFGGCEPHLLSEGTQDYSCCCSYISQQDSGIVRLPKQKRIFILPVHILQLHTNSVYTICWILILIHYIYPIIHYIHYIYPIIYPGRLEIWESNSKNWYPPQRDKMRKWLPASSEPKRARHP